MFFVSLFKLMFDQTFIYSFKSVQNDYKNSYYLTEQSEFL